MGTSRSTQKTARDESNEQIKFLQLPKTFSRYGRPHLGTRRYFASKFQKVKRGCKKSKNHFWPLCWFWSIWRRRRARGASDGKLMKITSSCSRKLLVSLRTYEHKQKRRHRLETMSKKNYRTASASHDKIEVMKNQRETKAESQLSPSAAEGALFIQIRQLRWKTSQELAKAFGDDGWVDRRWLSGSSSDPSSEV